jgi:uncharacterized protein (TIGR04255 family)
MSGQLKNPPLIEAILEIKWKLKKIGPDTFVDPAYKLATGRLYDRINTRFSHIQDLAINAIPEEMTPYVARQQFRSEKNGWPLVQIGPGLATINFTTPYSWKEFKETVRFFLPKLVSAYKGLPTAEGANTLEPESVLLRYINMDEIDWSQENILGYFSDKLHTTISLPDSIATYSKISGVPDTAHLQIGYMILKPKGQALIHLGNGMVGQKRGTVWELLFRSEGKDTPDFSDTRNFLAWLTDAHNVLENWFFALIEGKLKNKFEGEL